MTFRSYNEIGGNDVSQLGEQVAAGRQAVALRLARVDRLIAVTSGKGGVGKSYVTSLLATGLARRGMRVGVLDADLRSPTVAGMLGAVGPLARDETGIEPAIGSDGIKIMSTSVLLADGQPLRWDEPAGERFVWRGTLETSALREFLADVRWGRLDYLLVDMPPGADIASDLRALVPDIGGAIAVTIPTEESRRSVERTMTATKEAGINILGVVENMSGCVCSECGARAVLFRGSAGADLAAGFSVPLLATIPFHAGEERIAVDGLHGKTLIDGLIEAAV
jgi:ATP-binding protein involved in chromosome partitioning